MEKHRLLSIHVSLIVFVGANLSACSHTATLPEPQTASGVYVHSGFEYYRWEEGLRLMIWHDGINHVSCSTSTNNRRYEIECNAIAYTNNSFEWHLETNDGITAKFIIDDHLFDLSDGNLFIATSLGEDTEVRQVKRDLSEVQANAESVTEFGLSDPVVLEFIHASSEIRDCISDCISSTIPKDCTEAPDVESAQQALVSFFSYLHDAEFEQASALYGGEYDVMQDQNPTIDPDDHASLFRNACTVNGTQCLEVRQSTLLDRPSPTEFRFSVEFSNEDGSHFSRGPCCGDDNPNNVDQTEFIYTVQFECTGKYYVLEAPVYLP